MKATNKNGITLNVTIKDYKFMTAKKIESFICNDTHKTANGLLNALKAENDKICKTFTGAKVAFMSVTIDWRKNRTWGWCPSLHAYILFEDGTEKEYDSYASGCGYDKGSTVLADLFNFACKPNWYAHRRRAKKPYGIYTNDFGMWFEGGIGVNCYYSIAEYLSGKMVHEVEAPNYDRFTFTFK